MHEQLSAYKKERHKINKKIRTVGVALVVFMVLTVSLSAAQSPGPMQVDNTLVNVLPANVIWQKTYGGTSDDRAYYSLPIRDGYLAVGSTQSVVADVTVGLAIRVDSEGNQVWNKTYCQSDGLELRFALNLTDGYLFVGNIFQPHGSQDGVVIRTDNEGTPVWNVTLGGSQIDKLFNGFIVSDGFVVTGLSDSYNSQSAGWVVKINNAGNVVWNRTYGASAETAFRCGVYGSDGDYIVTGYTNRNGEDNYDFCLYEIGINGNVIWNYTYGAENSEKAYSMTQSADGYILVGDVVSTISNTDAWVVKVDQVGNKLWDKEVGGKFADSAAYITTAKDGGYLVAGFTFSFGMGERDFWLFKMDTTGQIIFSCTYGNSAFQEAYSVTETSDNAYVMAGWTDPFSRPDLVGMKKYDFMLVKLSVSLDRSELSTLQVVEAIFTVAIVTATGSYLLKLQLKKSKQKKL